MPERILLASPHMSDEGYELEYIHDAFRKNWIAPLGENVNEFEKAIQEYMGFGHLVALSAGTAALHLAMILVGIKPGDMVFCQSLTFSASANPIAYLGAKPVFIDSERETWNMDPAALEKAVELKLIDGYCIGGLTARQAEIWLAETARAMNERTEP